MNDVVGVIVFIIAVAVFLGRLTLRVREALGRLGGNPAASLTPVERSVQRELQKYLREHKTAPAPAPVAPAPRPVATVAVQLPPRPRPEVPQPPPAPPRRPPPIAQPAPAPQPAARREPVRASSSPAPARRVPQVGPRRPLRLNPRVMARVAILSEVWRPPLALRQEQPWERS